MTDTAEKPSAFATAAELASALEKGGTTSTAIVRRALDRVAAHEQTLHAFVEIFGEAALAAAEAADERRVRGATLSPLDGIPFAVKDLMHMEGHPTSAGSKAVAGKPATTTANAVRRLSQAGMIPLGKVHTVEFAFGSWGTNPILGTPLNPRDRAVARAPGGSSSGSGVAVAAGLVPAALGTDTGGSVRNPSAMCGVVGLKTSVGLVGRGGLLPLATSFDSIGPLTRSVEDAALLLSVLQGLDPDDPATFGITAPDPLRDLGQGVAGLQLRVPSERDLEMVEDGVLRLFRAAVQQLSALGAEIDEKTMPRRPEEYKAITGDLMAAEAWHNLSDYVESESSIVHPVVRTRILQGRTIDGARFQELLATRRAAQIEFHRYLEGADAFLTPTSPIFAPPLTEIDETKTPLGTFTRMVNLMDMAALSVPVGLAGGLPAALQIVVRRFNDALALRIGRAFEVARGGLFEPPAGYQEPQAAYRG
ncbi:amidase [Mesorhizobium sp. BAC0120]|uniref:amidase n=1 Tax=Mesorhizobium sp. BAC0120 TaxID=3090670 RepID=UPI00298C1D2A|nr:amidase [Mesorhizobium sp. BAC0120]MDW6022652.1 amidase [Mesorhizobium sp. BAC0120]